MCNYDVAVPETEPYLRKLRKSYKRLQVDVLSLGSGMLAVSERLRQAVESVEPGVHQFLPTDFRNRDGTPFPATYWVLHIRQFLDSYVWGAKTMFPAKNRLGRERHDVDPLSLWPPQKPTDLQFRALIVEGHHLWHEARAKRTIFISDVLLDAFIKTKINVVKSWEVELV